jgi:predicted nuclease of predicted toxin-antitoxin system
MKLLFDQNLSFKLCQNLADLFPESNHVRLLGFRGNGGAVTHAAESNLVARRKSIDSSDLVVASASSDLRAAFEKDDDATCLEIYERT